MSLAMSASGWERKVAEWVALFDGVRSLSLTGALLYRLRLADAFFVQWQALAATHARARCLGRVM